MWREGNRVEMPDGEREFLKGKRLVDAIERVKAVIKRF